MGFRTIFNDVTAGTAVNPAVSTIPQVIKTFNLDVTDDELIAITALVRVTVGSGAASTAQTINLIVTVGSNTYSVPYAVTSTIANASDDYVTIVFPCVSRAGDTVNVQLGGGNTADTHTVVNVLGFFIQAWSGGRGGT
jgi:hypothetical protein